MTSDIDRELELLQRMTVPQLRARHLELFGEPPRSVHKTHLVRRLIWRLQALSEGDMTDRARRRAAELACDADLRIRAPAPRQQLVGASQGTTPPDDLPPSRDCRLPMPGTLLVRDYRGETLQVNVLEQGFEYDSQIYDSLTAVVRKITGQHWNGFHFFGLREGK